MLNELLENLRENQLLEFHYRNKGLLTSIVTGPRIISLPRPDGAYLGSPARLLKLLILSPRGSDVYTS